VPIESIHVEKGRSIVIFSLSEILWFARFHGESGRLLWRCLYVKYAQEEAKEK
jgi:hypothetical protein